MMTDIPSWVSIGYCDCKDTCSRWVINDDDSGGWFCPDVPETQESGMNNCKKLHHFLGKNIQPTIVKKKVEDD